MQPVPPKMSHWLSIEGLLSQGHACKPYTTSVARPISAFLALSIDVSKVLNFLDGTPNMNISSSSTNDLFFVSLFCQL